MLLKSLGVAVVISIVGTTAGVALGLPLWNDSLSLDLCDLAMGPVAIWSILIFLFRWSRRAACEAVLSPDEARRLGWEAASHGETRQWCSQYGSDCLQGYDAFHAESEPA